MSSEHAAWGVAVVGLVLLVVGRRLYLFTIGLAGFVVGWLLVSRLELGLPPVVEIGLALAVGVTCALLVLLVQRLAVALAGFVLGGFALLWIRDFYGIELVGWQWLLLLVGAAVAAVALWAIFDTALIVFSSLIGASMLVDASSLDGRAAMVMFVVLLSLGVAVQTRGQARRQQVANQTS